jgi:membrane-associated protease RseP (regulator of RpoE activity)
MIDHPDVKIFLSFFTIVNMIVSRAGSLIFAVTMVFMFTLCSAIGYLMQQKEKNFSCVLMYFFSVAYTVLAVAYAINQFINLPFSLEWVNIPLGIVFLLSTYFITDKIEELR